MSNSSKRSAKVAHVEDARDDDSNSSLEGIASTRIYATSEAPGKELRKERPNTGKSRADKRPPVARSRSRSSSAGAGLTDEASDSTARSSERAKDSRRRPARRDTIDPDGRDQYREERRRERRAREEDADRRAKAAAAKERESKTPKKTRPPGPKHSATQPVVQQPSYMRGHVEDPAFYGVKQPAASGGRPRAKTRPATFYAGQPVGPQMMVPGGFRHGPGHPPPISVGSFPPPPPMWSGAAGSPGNFGPPPPLSPAGPPPAGYFDAHSHLKQRFDTRPSSAMGFQRPPPPPPPALEYHHDDYADERAPRVARRPSRSKRLEEDARRMPPPSFIPPARPQSAMPPASAFRPPAHHPPPRQTHSRPPPSNRRSLGFEQPAYDDPEDYEDDEDEGGLFQISPNASYDQRRAVVPRGRRASMAYDQNDYEIVPAGNRSRRSSMYGPGGLASGGASLGHNKLHAAKKYQDEVSGGAQMPLTAESLRKAMKRGGVPSSRSTRSSGSRDDSEYKRSNTTGLTQSSYGGNEEITIKVPGNTVVRFQGAEIECSHEGGEITWSSRPTGSRTGSDRASMIYQQFEDSRAIEDSRSRMEHKALSHRQRAPSQADSHSRGYAPAHAPYDPYASGNVF
ncbi:low affinity iron transporter [Purpureocillium lavendulum]|uniref:Low affinity iron transporter n=1 Tax=Purpureocillium lavendulum TaxID=1247861 RepID=A0AB34FT20_9HYPO|nr:low affinity iron transporter [Purpureocillium lavendulum]